MVASEQTAFLEILIFIVGALLFVGIGSLVSFLLRPRRPNPDKLRTYESGEEAIGSAWGRFDTRSYVVAIVFMLFEVETVLLFPWSTVWANSTLNEATGGIWVNYTAISAALFITLLAVGLAYVWSQGHLASTQSPLPASPIAYKVPKALYDRVNSRYASAITRKNEQVTN